jgi:ATP-dependent DNA ligase
VTDRHVFPVHAAARRDLRGLPLSERRNRLTALMQTCRPPLQQVPFTLDHGQAAQWLRDYAAAHIGIEGLVLKRVDEPYVGGVRRWSKLRHRDTAEVLVGAVTGSVEQPARLIVPVPVPVPDPDTDHGLIVAGGTSLVSRAQSAEVAAFLRPPSQPHPWPTVIPGGHSRVWAANLWRSRSSTAALWWRSSLTPPSCTAAGATSSATSGPGPT